MALRGKVDQNIQLTGSVGVSQLTGRTTLDQLSGNTGMKVLLSGQFGFGFDDPWLLYRAVWNDSDVWVDAAVWKDDLS